MQVPAIVKHLVIQVFPVRLKQVILLRLPRCGLPAAPAALLDDARHIRAAVAQVHRDVFRLFPPVPPLQLYDPLTDLDPALRQRTQADLVQLQPIQVFARFRAQLQPADGDRHRRLTMPVQPCLRPGLQVCFRRFALVRLNLVNSPIQALVFLQVFSVDMQVVLPDRINPGIHPAPGDAPLHCVQIPPASHFTGNRVVPLPDMKLEREHIQAVFPYRVLQRLCDRLDRVINALAGAELVWIAHVILEVTQLPYALQAQQVLHRLLCRHRRRAVVSGQRFCRYLIGQLPVVQNLDHMLQADRPRFCIVLIINRLDPPDVIPLRPAVVQDPVRKRDLRIVRPQLNRAAAVPFLQYERLAFRLKPFAARQTAAVHSVHIRQTSRCSSP